MPLVKSFETPIWIAMLGFALAVWLLTKPGCKESVSSFTELKVSQHREAIDNMLRQRLVRLDSVRARLASKLVELKCVLNVFCWHRLL